MKEDISLISQISCVAREIAIRTIVYPQRVKAGKMTQEEADYEIARMKAVLETVKAALKRETA